ncbi:hypothetical protein LVJ94_42970 [Pendulispora rubella]|uniref:Tetratricopeptide repeat protein n=1 Tax=Pendulispora rubella TaxID=2741070 RepID=A0ABZ2KZZ1_9BACT
MNLSKNGHASGAWAKLAAATIVAVCALPGVAHAEDKAGAAALFAEAGKLVDAGQPARACPKYEESLRLFESVNTRYFLADCYERIGRNASAWALYLEVAAKASDDPAKVDRARERAGAVAPKVSHLTVAADAKQTSGLAIKRDGAELGPGQWGVAMPVDPGPHVVEATAPGKKPWRAEVQVAPNGAKARIAVPAMEDVASESAHTSTPVASPETAPPQDASLGNGQRTLGLIVGGTGIAAMGAGVVLAFMAKSKYDDAASYCNGDRCVQEGVDLRDSAVSRATVATVVFGVGLAATVGGGLLWFTAPRAKKQTSVGLTPNGFVLRGTF